MTFRNIIILFFFTWITLGYSQATANFTASATIIQPISITTTSNMNFANIDAKNGGEVVLKPDNSRQANGGVQLDNSTNVSAASFEVTGQSGYTFSISLPDTEQVLTNGTETMVIKNFSTDFDLDTSLGANSTTIRVGATLAVNPNQTPGTYTSPSSMQVTVNYN